MQSPDRLPPHAPEYEAIFIGCLLNGEAETLNAALAEASEEMFYDHRNATVFRCVARLVSDGRPISLITVRQQLADDGALESAGGIAHLSACLDNCPSASLWFHYLEGIREKHTRRRLGAVCAAIGAEIYGTTVSGGRKVRRVALEK
ncbi:MAG: hypothetical protein B9S33_18570 [Pedosphaera sp. Tous-C6FEB]|nr:MAG: hypothetical protein B9S33_18570 [Pedosphaera sp. Tous-C6FEB]